MRQAPVQSNGSACSNWSSTGLVAKGVDRADRRYVPGHDLTGSGFGAGRVDQLRIFPRHARRSVRASALASTLPTISVPQWARSGAISKLIRARSARRQAGISYTVSSNHADRVPASLLLGATAPLIVPCSCKEAPPRLRSGTATCSRSRACRPKTPTTSSIPPTATPGLIPTR